MRLEMGLDTRLALQQKLVLAPQILQSIEILQMTNTNLLEFVEEQLQESEARYRLITENANDMISLLDKDGLILYLSPSVRSLLDYEPDNLLGTPAFDLLHPEDLEQVRERWAQLDLQRRAQVTYRIRHRNGSWRWFDMQGTIIEQQGQRYIVSVSRDITVADIITAIEGRTWSAECIGEDERPKVSANQDIWRKVQGQVMTTLHGMTVADLVEEKKKQTA